MCIILISYHVLQVVTWNQCKRYQNAVTWYQVLDVLDDVFRSIAMFDKSSARRFKSLGICLHSHFVKFFIIDMASNCNNSNNNNGNYSGSNDLYAVVLSSSASLYRRHSAD